MIRLYILFHFTCNWLLCIHLFLAAEITSKGKRSLVMFMARLLNTRVKWTILIQHSICVNIATIKCIWWISIDHMEWRLSAYGSFENVEQLWFVKFPIFSWNTSTHLGHEVIKPRCLNASMYFWPSSVSGNVKGVKTSAKSHKRGFLFDTWKNDRIWSKWSVFFTEHRNHLSQ